MNSSLLISYCILIFVISVSSRRLFSNDIEVLQSSGILETAEVSDSTEVSESTGVSESIRVLQSSELLQNSELFQSEDQPTKAAYYFEQTIAILQQVDATIEECELLDIYSEEQKESHLADLSSKMSVESVDMDKMHEILDSCQHLDKNNNDTDTEEREGFNVHNLFKHLIYVGTNWCGKGNVAENYRDLGRWSENDRCCRAHDYCPMQIKPHTTR